MSSLSYIIFYKEIEYGDILNHAINCLITLIISMSFYYLRIWAAGDAKLFWALSYILPFSIYEVDRYNLFPMVYLLIIIFSIAFIYVVVETAILWARDKNKFKKIQITKLDKFDVRDFVKRYLANYSFILLLNNVIYRILGDVASINAPLILVSDMLIIMIIYKKIHTTKSIIILLATTFILNVIYYTVFKEDINVINVKMLTLIILLMVFQHISEKYNYEEINVTDLKPGMILSAETVILFFNSKVKGLPIKTTEWTDSRITEEEVKSIQRWEKTAKGRDKIITVKYMPFAPFICVGTIIYLLIKVVL